MASALSETQIRELKERLRQRYYELREEIRQNLLASDNEQYIELAGQVHDLEDASVADVLVDVNLAFIDQHIQEIREIDAALLRISTDAYGVCTDCGDYIGYERLNAYPTAQRCHVCQVMFEKTHAQRRRPTL